MDLLNNRKQTVKIKKLSHFHGKLPIYQSQKASGFDIRACLDQSIELLPLKKVLIPTGLAFEIPEGFEIQVRPRSGLALKYGIFLPNTPGTIDADYRGELKIILMNLGEKSFTIHDQDRIAQLVLSPVYFAELKEVKNLNPTQRGEKGFGSTKVHC